MYDDVNGFYYTTPAALVACLQDLETQIPNVRLVRNRTGNLTVINEDNTVYHGDIDVHNAEFTPAPPKPPAV